jgi:hypothetical protein
MADDEQMKNERLEIVLEEQKEYARFADMALSFIAGTDESWSRTVDGKPKLAKWRFVSKGSTMLTDPADYLAFAMHEAWTSKGSKKTEWCTPILKSNDGIGLGRILKRHEVRGLIDDLQMADFVRLMEKRMKIRFWK